MKSEVFIERLSQVLSFEYGLSGTLQALRAYEGYNFRLTSQNSSYVVKLTPAHIATETISGRNALLNHLQQQNISFSTPKVVQSKDSQEFLENPFAELCPQYHLQVLSYVDGQVIVNWRKQKLSLFRQWGSLCASMQKGLQGFHHPSFELKSSWNFSGFSSLITRIAFIADKETRLSIERQVRQFEDLLLPRLLELPKSVLHHDLNELNILFDIDAKGNAKITGVIDFQDACISQTVGELAIACAYAMMNLHAPQFAMETMLGSYRQKLELSQAEEDLLLPLIKTRLAMSILHSSYEFSQNPKNTYLLHSQKPAKRLLMQLNSAKKTSSL